MKKTELKGNWQLLLAPHNQVIKDDFSPVTVAELEAAPYLKLKATVPGCMELDLYAAGLVPDPYFGENPLQYQQYENRHMWYYTVFDCDAVPDEHTSLCLEGIDTVAEIYLNGVLIGKSENMFLPFEKDRIDGLLKKKGNELVVHILPATIAARDYPLRAINRTQYYNEAACAMRKAAYMYGWDIMPRFVSGGLWKPVYLVQKNAVYFEECYLYTKSIKPAEGTASLTAFAAFRTDDDLLCDYKITVDGVCGDSIFHAEKRPYHIYESFSFKPQNAKYWYPKCYGDQPLYDVTFRLWRGEALMDEKSFRFGIRMVELDRTSVLEADGTGKFDFIVNGKRVFCLGTNWVPLDAFPSRHKERLPKALELLGESGCNMVRCWGGNIYEDDAFYDFCDENGILIWQDFGMGCCVYPEDEDFLTRLQAEAEHTVKRLRNHASLGLWAGDNEVDIFAKGFFGKALDPNDNPATRRILPWVVRNHDCIRPYIPSSPYLDGIAVETGKKPTEDHLWGPRDYFKGNYYKGAKTCFASEIGYHGCPSPESLKKYISTENLYPMLDEKGNGTPEYLVHAAAPTTDPKEPYAYRIPLMVKQVRTLFGAEADNLEDFAKQSQISQAEAKKYFIEKFRIGKPHCSGLIWWNLLDGWPQVSDAVIDWYYCKKLAFSYIQRSQQQLCLMFDEPVDGKLCLVAVQDGGKTEQVTYTVKDAMTGELLLSGTAEVGADASVRLESMDETEELRFLLIEWQTESGICGKNHFVTKTLNISYSAYMKALQNCGFDTFEGF